MVEPAPYSPSQIALVVPHVVLGDRRVADARFDSSTLPCIASQWLVRDSRNPG
jgi:hypothetical protein